jgi:sec-independent protein translocase protein TatA
MIGTQDLIILLVIVVVLFGARKLPEIGKGLGQSIRDFKKAVSEHEEIEAPRPFDKLCQSSLTL